MIFKDILFEKTNQPHKMATEYRVTVVLQDGQRVYCGNILTDEAQQFADHPLTHLKEKITYEITDLIMDKLQKQIYTAVDSMEKLSKSATDASESLSEMISWGKIEFEDDEYKPSESPMITYDDQEDGSVVVTHQKSLDPSPGHANMSELKKAYHEGKQELLKKQAEFDKFHTGGAIPKKSSFDYSSSSIVKELQKIFPNITQKVKHPVTGKQERLNNIIVNLNDFYKWNREEIAEWIETLSLDLNAQEYDATMEMIAKTPAEVSHNAGSNKIQVQKGEFVVEFDFNAENYNQKVKDALEELNMKIIEKEKEK